MLPVVVRLCFLGLKEIILLFPAQEELGRTISQLVHAFQTTEAREYPYPVGRPEPLSQ